MPSTASFVTPAAVARMLRAWAFNASSPVLRDAFDRPIGAETARVVFRAAGRIERQIPADDPRLDAFLPFAFATIPGVPPFLAMPVEVDAFLVAASPHWSAGRWLDGLAGVFRAAPPLTVEQVAEVQAALTTAVELESRGRRMVRGLTADGLPCVSYVSRFAVGGGL